MITSNFFSDLADVVHTMALEGINNEVMVYWNLSSDFENKVDGLKVFWCLHHDGKCEVRVMLLSPDKCVVMSLSDYCELLVFKLYGS
jgi:hypothetical protein